MGGLTNLEWNELFAADSTIRTAMTYDTTTELAQRQMKLSQVKRDELLYQLKQLRNPDSGGKLYTDFITRQAEMAGNSPRRATARRKARRSCRKSGRDRSVTRANRAPGSNLNNTQHSEGFLPPTGWSWTRPGLYPEAAPLAPAPRRARTGCPAGPGLPDGDATGDDD